MTEAVTAGEAVDLARRRLATTFPLVNNHPDVAGVLRDAESLRLLGPALAAPFREHGITKVVAPEARGPIIGALVAVELGAGLVLGRKQNSNHPGADTDIISAPTWRGAEQHFITRSFDFVESDVALVVDDWVTTGHSLQAMRDAIDGCGATYAGAAVIVNKAAPETIEHHRVHWLAAFDDIVLGT